MPYAAAAVCLTPGCSGVAVEGGRCPRCRPTTSQRGYGADWQRTSRRLRAGRRCEACGSTSDLTADHIQAIPLGGTGQASNLRVLCRSCHGSIGEKRDRVGKAVGGATADGFRSAGALTAAPLCAHPQNGITGSADG